MHLLLSTVFSQTPMWYCVTKKRSHYYCFSFAVISHKDIVHITVSKTLLARKNTTKYSQKIGQIYLKYTEGYIGLFHLCFDLAAKACKFAGPPHTVPNVSFSILRASDKGSSLPNNITFLTAWITGAGPLV